jgi:hypothetical protein
MLPATRLGTVTHGDFGEVCAGASALTSRNVARKVDSVVPLSEGEGTEEAGKLES